MRLCLGIISRNGLQQCSPRSGPQGSGQHAGPSTITAVIPHDPLTVPVLFVRNDQNLPQRSRRLALHCRGGVGVGPEHQDSAVRMPQELGDVPGIDP
jgi:hypothetical protein